MESNSEIEDIHYIAKYIARFVKAKNPKGKYSMAQIHAAFREPLNIYSPTVIDTVDNIVFDFWPIEGRMFAEFYLNSMTIKVDAKKIKKYKNYDLETTLSHEIQHALDYMKSKGHAFTKDVSYQTTDHATYLRWKEEINARMTEVLLLIAKKSPTRAQLPTVINNAFAKREIFRELYNAGPKGQKQYNRLLSRAYKFYDEMIQTDKSKPGWLGLIKSLISKFI